MARYRFYLLRDSGVIKRGSAFTMADDKKAIALAKAAAGDDLAEIWSGDTLLWRHGPEKPVGD